MIAWARSRPERSTHVEGHSHSAGTKPDAWTSTTTSLIAGVGCGRSASVIPAVSAAGFVATIAFTGTSVPLVPVGSMRAHYTPTESVGEVEADKIRHRREITGV